MSLEQALADNTAAINALAAIMSKGGAAPAADKPKADKPKTETKAETKVEAKTEPAGLDYETEVKPKVLGLVKAKGRDVMDKLLADKFSVKSAKELKAEQWPALLEAIAAAEAEEDVA